MCWLLWTSRVFHINISIISIVYFSQYIELLIGKLLMGFYQYGFISIPGIPRNRSYLGWAELDPLQIPNIQKYGDALPMFIGSFMIWHYMMSMVFFIFFYNLERVIATFLVGSYEKHSRSYISITILIVANGIALKCAHMLFYFQIDFVQSAIICSTAVIVAMAMYLSVMAYNLHLSSRLKHDIARKRFTNFDKYTLAYKFQLEENLKVFQLVKKVIISIGIYVLLNILCVFLINSNNLSASVNISLVFLVENCININPLLICTVTINSVPPWRQICLQDIDNVLEFLGIKRVGGKVHHDKKAPVREGSGTAIGRLEARVESDIYFRDLKTMWA